MPRTLPTKTDLIAWTEGPDGRGVDLVSKTILGKLALFANEEGDTWRKVESLAEDCNCSVRTVQYRLRQLIELDYLRDTGRLHRLKGSTRSVPIYVLRPTFEAEQAAEIEASGALSMGANPAPIDEAWVQEAEGMGATGCTPKETLETQRSDDLNGRARKADFERLESAYPAAGLGFSDARMAWRAFVDLVGGGIEPGALIAAAGAYAADPILAKRDYGPVGLHRWLGEGRYRAWLPAIAKAGPTAAGLGEGSRTGFAELADLRAAVVAAKGDAFTRALFDAAAWDGSARTLTTASPFAFRELGTLADTFTEHRVALAPPRGTT